MPPSFEIMPAHFKIPTTISGVVIVVTMMSPCSIFPTSRDPQTTLALPLTLPRCATLPVITVDLVLVDLAHIPCHQKYKLLRH